MGSCDTNRQIDEPNKYFKMEPPPLPPVLIELFMNLKTNYFSSAVNYFCKIYYIPLLQINKVPLPLSMDVL